MVAHLICTVTVHKISNISAGSKMFLCLASYLKHRGPFFNQTSPNTCWRCRNDVRDSIGSCSQSRWERCWLLPYWRFQVCCLDSPPPVQTPRRSSNRIPLPALLHFKLSALLRRSSDCYRVRHLAFFCRSFPWALLRANSCARQLRVFCFPGSSQKSRVSSRNAAARLGSSGPRFGVPQENAAKKEKYHVFIC